MAIVESATESTVVDDAADDAVDDTPALVSGDRSSRAMLAEFL
jgi:hypothetical protein